MECNFVDYVLPSQFVKPLCLEFKGLTSDFLLFKFMTFIGGRIEDLNKNNSKLSQYIFCALDTITDLDPYYWDAYYFSQMFLALNNKVEDANILLEKARKYRINDYRPPYYIGFNYFYFLKDNEKGSQYLMEASKLPGSRYYFASLAARLAVYSFQHRDGIIFLEEMLKETRDERAKKEFELRIATLEVLEILENKITEYHKLFGVYPASLNELVKKRLIDKIPEDPYGGDFIIMQNGRIYTTSNMVMKTNNK
ncbi:hypothetical protein [Desulfobacula phenolica]|uniref:hypothetical protein n=1 Tax=Desulfobacula phenolica TaxID=90732 RepID=UPI001113A781|nr:hypothetical protein [Desulfobacula phenolica]